MSSIEEADLTQPAVRDLPAWMSKPRSITDAGTTVSLDDLDSRETQEVLELYTRDNSTPDDDLPQEVKEQIFLSSLTKREHSGKDTFLIPEESPQPPFDGDDDPGDQSWFVRAAQTALAITAIAALSISGWWIVSTTTRQPVAQYKPPVAASFEAGAGSVIERPQPNAPTSSTAPAAPATPERISIPPGGSLASYTVSTEGNITAMSVSYRNGQGQPQSEVGASSPWTKNVGMEKGTYPAVSVATTGEGVISCEIRVDGKTLKQNTAAGANPTIQCGA